MWKRTIPSKSTRRSWPSRPRAALIRSRRIEELKRAAVSVSLVQSKEDLASAVTSASEMAKVTSPLHQSCDWLLQILTPGKRPVPEKLRV